VCFVQSVLFFRAMGDHALSKLADLEMADLPGAALWSYPCAVGLETVSGEWW
jgi:hypothetical protein